MAHGSWLLYFAHGTRLTVRLRLCLFLFSAHGTRLKAHGLFFLFPAHGLFGSVFFLLPAQGTWHTVRLRMVASSPLSFLVFCSRLMASLCLAARKTILNYILPALCHLKTESYISDGASHLSHFY
jgi:hypothetical protein